MKVRISSGESLHHARIGQLGQLCNRSIRWSPDAIVKYSGAGSGPRKAGQERQTGLATTSPRVHDTETDVGRHAGAQGLDEKAAGSVSSTLTLRSSCKLVRWLGRDPGTD